MTEKDTTIVTYKRELVAYMSICMNCLGSGHLATKTGCKKCPECAATGEVQRYFNKIVAVEVDTDG